MPFYLQYLAKWPDLCFTAEGPGGRPMGYVLGKAESFASEQNSWHGHVTAVTVPPEYAATLCTALRPLALQPSSPPPSARWAVSEPS